MDRLGNVQLFLGIPFDSLTVVVLVVVTSVSSLVHLYSTEYGSRPPFLRFMSYLSLFTFFMLILVTADNFLQMFVGWEGAVYVHTYLLIFGLLVFKQIKQLLKLC